MNEISTDAGLILSVLLFGVGIAGVLWRRNLISVLISIEIMLNAASLAFIVSGSRWRDADGQVMFVLILTLAAAEAAIGLVMVLCLFYQTKTLDSDTASRMRG